MSEMYADAMSQLHVLRHRFEVSPMLDVEVYRLFKPGVYPGILFRSTKEAYVDASMYALNRYYPQTRGANAVVDENKRTKFAIGQVVTRVLYRNSRQVDTPGYDEGKIRISLMPAETGVDTFNTLLDSLNAFPDMYPRAEPRRHYLYAEYPLSRIRDDDEFMEGGGLEGATRRLQEKIGKAAMPDFYTANVIGIEGGIVPVPIESLRPGWRSKAK